MVAIGDERLRRARTALARFEHLEDVASRLLQHQVHATGARAGVVALLDGDDELEVVAATGYAEDYLETWQRFPITASTPLTEAVRTRSTIVVPSVEQLRERYPDVVPPDDEPHALAAFPVIAGGDVLGGVGLRFDTAALAEPALAAGVALSESVAATVAQHQSVEVLSRQVAQLQVALDSRIVIEQAKGILAERHGEHVDVAFERLRGYARRNELRLHDVCRDVVDGSLRL